MRTHGGPDPDERPRRRGQGELESQVLAELSRAPGPVTAAWVQERLGGDLAYTTVMTILTRLHAKHVVTRERTGRSFEWRASSDEAGLAALRMRKVLDGEADREAVLTRFVTALSPDDERLLRDLLGLPEDAPVGPPPGGGSWARQGAVGADGPYGHRDANSPRGAGGPATTVPSATSATSATSGGHHDPADGRAPADRPGRHESREGDRRGGRGTGDGARRAGGPAGSEG